jgi:phosphoribosylamine--glycine ligase
MNIAILGSGGRESALAWRLSGDIGADHVFVFPGNAGTPNRAPLKDGDMKALVEICRSRQIDYLIPGGEAPLVAGLVEHLAELGGPPVIGPSAGAARLEGSKAFSREFMIRHGVATAAADIFCGTTPARISLEKHPRPIVLKFDGLAAGKGVWVCPTASEAQSALEQIERTFGRDALIVAEELLTGDEVSLIAFTDGKTARFLPPCQDHKQAFDGDTGPNTGGMGAFAPVSWCSTELMTEIQETIVSPTLLGIQRQGFSYQGPLFFGIMITPSGPRLLEYNVRFGDPETQALVPLIGGSLLELYLACRRGELNQVPLAIKPGFQVAVVLAAATYPESGLSGVPLPAIDQLPPGVVVFHGATAPNAAGTGSVTNGGRILTVSAHGETLEHARDLTYQAISRIQIPGTRFRSDISKRTRQVFPSRRTL